MARREAQTLFRLRSRQVFDRSVATFCRNLRTDRSDANVALNVLTNYTNHIAGTDVDFPVVPLAL